MKRLTSLSKILKQCILLICIICNIFPFCDCVCPIGCLCDDESLEVTCIDAHLDFVPITLNPSVQKLILRRNRIRSLDGGLSFYHELNQIDLSHNHLLKISPNSFLNQEKLTTLLLNNNKVSTISNTTFSSGSDLISLNLRGNLIQNLESGTFKSTIRLEELDIGENQLNEITFENLDGLNNLRILKLDRNELRQVPSLFNNLTNNGDILFQLTELYLGNNQLTTLEAYAFNALPNLSILDLRSSNIRLIHPEAFNSLNYLKKLILSDNSLQYIPSPSFHPLQQLELLRMSRNPIQNIQPYSISALKNLKIFEFNGAIELENIHQNAFRNNLNLEMVDISNAKKLKYLPSELFTDLANLRTLILKENALSILPQDLTAWENIDNLRLDGNPWSCSCETLWLHDILTLTKFRNLSQFALCHTPIHLNLKRISSLNPSIDLQCDSGWSVHTILAISLSLVILFLIIFFTCLYKYHNRVKSLCKRSRVTGQCQPEVVENNAGSKATFLTEEEYGLINTRMYSLGRQYNPYHVYGHPTTSTIVQGSTCHTTPLGNFCHSHQKIEHCQCYPCQHYGYSNDYSEIPMGTPPFTPPNTAQVFPRSVIPITEL